MCCRAEQRRRDWDWDAGLVEEAAGLAGSTQAWACLQEDEQRKGARRIPTRKEEQKGNSSTGGYRCCC